ncbi:DUF3592 domain-containing protein [uncultured Pseudokineococcus sp.]|uniref:DUF3592 domain-containing protein n=1 Tax=uncultured Pseudokineococcus sp. TaxID=1642928 RepID=UPI002632C34F|nr:DUF3592 domain-containing protein [uncultured Pseudokineococcus sp.]
MVQVLGAPVVPAAAPAAGGGWLAVTVAVVFLVLGLALAALGVLGLVRAARVRRRGSALRARGERVRGAVVDVQINQRGRGRDAATSYRPVVRFTTAGAQEVTTVAGPSATASWLERTPVVVLHDPADPEHAEVLEPVPGVRVSTSTAGPAAVGVLLVVLGGLVAGVAAAGLVG